jgi:hypothetical protein
MFTGVKSVLFGGRNKVFHLKQTITAAVVVKIQLLTVASVKMLFFPDVVPCSLVKIYRLSEVLSASITRAKNVYILP